MSRGVGHSWGMDPVLPWLWCRLAAAAPIWPMAWELPYAAGVALKRKKKKKLNIDLFLPFLHDTIMKLSRDTMPKVGL